MRNVLAGIGLFCLAAPASPPPCTLATIDAYARQVDANQALTTRWHMHTYGHAANPGADTLFQVFATDFQGVSFTAYFAGRQLVKLIETVRGPNSFSEYTYYLRDDNVLLVKNRQVRCPILTQIAAWRKRTLPATKTPAFFRGRYYFAQDSCIARQERGTSDWESDYSTPATGWLKVPAVFPVQGARYVAVFRKVPADKLRLRP